jgi:hypothetical protein
MKKKLMFSRYRKRRRSLTLRGRVGVVSALEKAMQICSVI